jgi:hypothetical protein
MRSDDYRRLHGACLIMAQQSKSPQVQARWLLMAQACLRRASVSDDTCRGTTELKSGAARESFGGPVNNGSPLRVSVRPYHSGSGQHEGTDGRDCDKVPTST